ncbi:MAG TPA: hypothetical protein VFO05_02150 [Candidatus Limnocylindrales bacterium]|nr:hypothetical protein [Candidatus Limnocylindrales bacterium]
MAPAPDDAPQPAVVASPAPIPAAAEDDSGPIALDGGRWSIVLNNDPARAPEREHGTDGLVGWFPFRDLYEASAADAARAEPASRRDGRIRWNGGLGWQADAYAE